VDQSITVQKSNTGLGVFASETLEPMTRIAQFAGPISTLDQIPKEQLNYILRATKDLYLTPETDARYVNHSCDPNCFIDDDLYIVTRTVIPQGTELNISYNRISEAEAKDWGNFWHPAWSFHCQCGATRCCGYVNKYITDEVRPYAEHPIARSEPQHTVK
jgi:hypothetical protein